MRLSFGLGLGCVACLSVLAPAEAFYIPGWSIKSYQDAEQVPLLVNKVYSDKTQLQYAYYDLPFVCPPSGRPRSGNNGLLSGQHIPLNLGEVLRGDRIATSDIDLIMGQNRNCTLLCERTVSGEDVKRARELVRDGYVVEWIVDNLPGATSFMAADKSRKYYAAGFKLGSTDFNLRTGKARYFLHNHHTIVIRYRKAPGKAGERGGKVIIGFEVYPKSIGPGVQRDAQGCPGDLSHVREPFELAPGVDQRDDQLTELPSSGILSDRSVSAGAAAGTTLSIPYTYSLYFREDETVEWNHRWDMYFLNDEQGSRIHWLAIVNSLIICGVLTGIVLTILAQTIRSDLRGHKDAPIEEGRAWAFFRRLSAIWFAGSLDRSIAGPSDQEAAGGLGNAEDDLLEDDEGLEDATGWKLLHGDVFRNPRNAHLLAPLIGSGMQLLFMAFGLVLLSALGILNPSFRGGFVSVGVGLFIFAGLFSGYFSARVHRTFDGPDFRSNAVVTAALFPGLLFGILFVLNLFVWAQASSTAVPFSTLIVVITLWLCVQTPLVYAGSWYGFVVAGPWNHPTKTKITPPYAAKDSASAGPVASRPVPPQPWYLQPVQCVLLAGLIPFTVIFVELLFVFHSVWQDKSGYYYLFGFLAVVCAILVVAVAEVTIVAVYLQLCCEDPHWWWRSFLVGGASAVWVFLCCAWYYLFKLRVEGFLSGLLFFSYSFLAAAMYGLLTGTVGFLAAYAFVRRIYGAVKVD